MTKSFVISFPGSCHFAEMSFWWNLWHWRLFLIFDFNFWSNQWQLCQNDNSVPWGSTSLASFRASEFAKSVLAGDTARMRVFFCVMYSKSMFRIWSAMLLGCPGNARRVIPGKSMRVRFNTGKKSKASGPLFTKKTPSYGYRDPHFKPKTVWRPPQVYNGNPYTDKTASS